MTWNDKHAHADRRTETHTQIQIHRKSDCWWWRCPAGCRNASLCRSVLVTSSSDARNTDIQQQLSIVSVHFLYRVFPLSRYRYTHNFVFRAPCRLCNFLKINSRFPANVFVRVFDLIYSPSLHILHVCWTSAARWDGQLPDTTQSLGDN